MKMMGQIPKEEKPAMGQLINQAKNAVQAEFDQVLARIEKAELAAKLGSNIDPSLPSPDATVGTRHPISQVRDEVVQLFQRIGFSVAEATELETEHFCFDALNMPADHPARDMQDSYYLPQDLKVANVSQQDESYLLRTHTSTVQIRTLLQSQPPIRIVAPGRCFRRDTPDATHSANFHQIEGLYVDQSVSLLDLKATLDYFVKTLFGPKAQTRLRPSFFLSPSRVTRWIFIRLIWENSVISGLKSWDADWWILKYSVQWIWTQTSTVDTLLAWA